MTTYEPITITRTRLIVEDPIPQRTLIHLDALNNTGFGAYLGRDYLHIGEDRRGNAVTYWITGWDAEQRGLIGELEVIPAPSSSVGGTTTSGEEQTP